MTYFFEAKQLPVHRQFKVVHHAPPARNFPIVTEKVLAGQSGKSGNDLGLIHLIEIKFHIVEVSVNLEVETLNASRADSGDPTVAMRAIWNRQTEVYGDISRLAADIKR